MTTYWKAVRPDGTDFFSGKVRWLPPAGEPLPEGGLIVRHPTATTPSFGDYAADYLSVSTEPTNCTGMQWPCRLALVEAVDTAVWTPDATALPNKRAAVAWLVTAEVDAWQALGPQGREVVAIIDRARMLTTDELRQLGAARVAARDAARDAARVAAWDAAWGAARAAARDAALATLVRDLITPKQHDLLMAPWRTVIGDIVSLPVVTTYPCCEVLA